MLASDATPSDSAGNGLPACSPDFSVSDCRLVQWLRTAPRAEADQLLIHLLEEIIQPVIYHVVSRKFGKDIKAPDAEDIVSEARHQLIHRLQRLRDESRAGEELPAFDLLAYTAAVTYTAWANHLRRRYPARAMLLNRLRHLLGNRAGPHGFALWQAADGTRLAGFSVWQAEGHAATQTPRQQWLLTDSAAAAADAFSKAGRVPTDLARLTAGLLDWLGGPVELRDLTGALMDLLGLTEPGDRLAHEAAEAQFAVLDPQPSPHETLRWKEYLGWLWREVMTLPLRQRTAFLCHSSLLREMELLGLTSIRAAAAALEISPERMAKIWARLPLNDLDIATLLANSNRQQIVNLRKVARATLGEAWRAFSKA